MSHHRRHYSVIYAALSPRGRAIVLAAVAALSVAATTQTAYAQYVWTGTSSGNFSDTTKWLAGNAPPASGSASTTLTFTPVYQTAAVTATLTPASTFLLNNLTFNTLGNPAFTVTGATGTFFKMSANGPTLPTITLSGNNIANNVIGAITSGGMQLDADTTIGGFGMGNLTISSIISESSPGRKLTISGTPATQFARMVRLGGVNTFTGGLVLDGGNLEMGVGGALGNASNTFTVTPNGGNLKVSGTSTVGNIVLNGKTTILDGSLTFGTATPTSLSGSGALLLNTTGTITCQTAQPSYTGVITTDRFDAPVYATAGHGVTLSGAGGSFQGVTTYNFRDGGILTATNNTATVAQNNDRIRDDAAINLSSSSLVVVGANATSNGGTGGSLATDTSEIVGAISGAGFSNISAQVGGDTTHKTTINAASLSRVDRGTFLFNGKNLGAGIANSGNIHFASSPTADLVGGGGSAGSTTISILPYAMGDASSTSNTGKGTSFVTLENGNVRPLDLTTEYATDLVSGATTNARVVGTVAGGGNTVNSLVLDGSVTGTGTLTVSSGAILSPASAAAGSSIACDVAFPNGVEGQVFSSSANFGGGLTISGQLSGNNGLTKSGDKPLFLSNPNNSGSLTGTLTLNGGTLEVSDPGALPGTGQIVSNGAGTGTGSSGVATILSYSGSGTMNLNRDIAANSGWMTIRAGGVLQGSGTVGSVVKLNGVISGNAGMNYQAQSAGTSPTEVWVTGTANTYTGPSRIAGGNVHIAGDGSLGNGGGVMMDGGALVLEGDWSTSRFVNVATNSTINTNGHNATLSGPMSSIGPFSPFSNGSSQHFIKIGSGTLNLSSTQNNFAGPLDINEGTCILNGTIGASASNPVTVGNTATPTIFATLGGTGTVYRPITVNAGSTLSPGNSAGILTEYGNLLLNSGSNFAVDLFGNTAGNGASFYDQMGVNGAVTLTGANLALSLGYAWNAADKLFILTNDGTDAITGTFAGLAEGSTVLLGYQNWGSGPVAISATISYLGDSLTGATFGGNDVVLYNFVPEPGTVGLLALGALGLLRRRRA